MYGGGTMVHGSTAAKRTFRLGMQQERLWGNRPVHSFFYRLFFVHQQ